MQDGDETLIGCQNIGTDLGHRASSVSRWRAGARMEWRISIEDVEALKAEAVDEVVVVVVVDERTAESDGKLKLL